MYPGQGLHHIPLTSRKEQLFKQKKEKKKKKKTSDDPCTESIPHQVFAVVNWLQRSLSLAKSYRTELTLEHH